MNPFGTSRVDTPFQDHVDLEAVFQDQFTRLKSIIDEIGADRNHQSRGVILAGEPGAGKTHLIMRLAREKISSNRILFIRQPNNPDAILFHIYTRIIESLVENVPGTGFTQIEYLLAKSFSRIFIKDVDNYKNPSAKMLSIRNVLSEDHLNLYRRIGARSTEKRRKNWRTIENRVVEWWSATSGWGLGATILKAFIKYCSYTDLSRREIIRRWLTGNELSEDEIRKTGLDNPDASTGTEEFAMEAMRVLGKLSTRDEPLVIVFDQLEGLKYNEELLFRFGECIKELFTHVPGSLMIFNFFPDRWSEYSAVFDESVVQRMSRDTVFLNPPSAEEMERILKLRASAFGQDADSIFTEGEKSAIVNCTNIRTMLNRASDYYKFKIQGIPLPKAIMGFEEEVKNEIAELKKEVAGLKSYLDMEIPTFSRRRNSMRVQSVVRAYRKTLEKELKDTMVISDSDDAGKLDTIVRALNRKNGTEITKIRHKGRKLPDHILVKEGKHPKAAAGFLHTGGRSFYARLKNFNDLASENTDIRFLLLRDQRVATIRSKKSLDEINRLNASDNGKFRIMDEEARLSLETVYRIVTDIQNRDLDISLDIAAREIRQLYTESWISMLLAEES
ncbi:MAG: exonuclease [Thermodesulfobacteriota bacterium]